MKLVDTASVYFVITNAVSMLIRRTKSDMQMSSGWGQSDVTPSRVSYIGIQPNNSISSVRVLVLHHPCKSPKHIIHKLYLTDVELIAPVNRRLRRLPAFCPALTGAAGCSQHHFRTASRTTLLDVEMAAIRPSLRPTILDHWGRGLSFPCGYLYKTEDFTATPIFTPATHSTKHTDTPPKGPLHNGTLRNL